MLLCKTSLYLLSIIVLTATSLFAGQLDPNLRHHLAEFHDSDQIRVLIFLSQQADIHALHRQHLRTSATRVQSHREVVQLLQKTANLTQAPLLSYLESLEKSGEAEEIKNFWIMNAIGAKVTKEEVYRIAAFPEVDEIELDVPVVLIEPVVSGQATGSTLDEDLITPGLLAIQADRVWHELGITGQGRLVSSLDTGVRLSHPALQSRWRGNTEDVGECWYDPLGLLYPFDYDSFATSFSRGHGTHTMGTMCGLSETTNDTIGVAWGARWIAGQGLYASSDENFITGVMNIYQWMSDPDGNPNTIDDVPDVSSNSWGVEAINTGYMDCDPRWNDAIYNMEAAGVVAVFACGNSGPDVQSLGSPANIADDDYFNFSVGAVDATNPEGPFDISSFSSRGPSDCDTTVIKPEIVAPGFNVYSSYARSYDYGTESGTSMACPHVAGVVALMREADPDLPVEMTKEILMRTALDLGEPGEDNFYGHGMLDAYAAVQAAQHGWGTVVGSVENAEGLPLVAVLTLENGQQTHSNSEGEFIFFLPGDSDFTITATCWGYIPSSVQVTVTAHQTSTPEIVMQLEPSGSLDGVILDEQFLPISGATIEVLDTPFPALNTLADGSFHFELPHSEVYGDYSVRIAALGLVDTLSGFTVVQDETTWFEHRMIQPSHLPMGADEYGYIAYDRNDSDDPARYSWFEIEPDSGGSGTRIDFDLNDQTEQVSLPFPFSFYGETYQQVSICCNGWVAFGSTSAVDYRNWPIPDSQGPPAVLSPFWEDFDPRNGGSISFYNDIEHGCFIIQFDHLAQAAPANTFETFQIVLYNTEQHPTRTGDGDIIFQYKHISDPTGCTIGIEDPSETIGLEYLFDDEYHENASVIENETAIRFTTGYDSLSGGVSGRIALVPSPQVVEATVTVGSRFIETNGRGEFVLMGIPAGVYSLNVELAVNGYEIDSIEELTIPEGTVVADQNLTLYRLDSPDGLTASQTEDWAVELNWNSPFPLVSTLRVSEDQENTKKNTRTQPEKSAKQGKSKTKVSSSKSRSGSANSLDELLGFEIYRNGELLTESWTDTTYLDTPDESGVFEYWVKAVYAGGESDTSNHVTIDYVSGIESEMNNGVPDQFALLQNHPNPFNPSTEISFQLPQSVRTELTIYNILGQVAVVKLVDSHMPAGTHHVIWDGKDSYGHPMSTGLYIYRLKAGSFIQSRKMILLR